MNICSQEINVIDDICGFKKPDKFYGYCLKNYESDEILFNCLPACLEVLLTDKHNANIIYNNIVEHLKKDYPFFIKISESAISDPGIGIGIWENNNDALIIIFDLSGVILKPFLMNQKGDYGLIAETITEKELKTLPRKLLKRLHQIRHLN